MRARAGTKARAGQSRGKYTIWDAGMSARLRGGLRALAIPALILLTALPARAGCRLALALGLDVSGSVDDAEYRLQLDGLAAALLRPEVSDALLAFPEAPVRLYVFEWAGRGQQRRVLDWAEIGSADDIARIAQILRGTGRIAMDPSTALGEAILTGAAALSQQGACWHRTLDLSGDGKSNTGPRPRDVAAPGITVNGLVIGSDARAAGDPRSAETGALQGYYANEVIRGPGAFTEVAQGFADFEAAMARKLLRELTVLVLSGPIQSGPIQSNRAEE